MTALLASDEFATSYNLTISPGPIFATAPPQYVPYVTGPSDRWDMIAWRAYGDATEIAPLIAANPAVAISPVLPQGITIYCPLITPPPPASGLPWLP